LGCKTDVFNHSCAYLVRFWLQSSTIKRFFGGAPITGPTTLIAIFCRPAGSSQRWISPPAIHAAKVPDRSFGAKALRAQIGACLTLATPWTGRASDEDVKPREN
jgi:hypothetical protein